MPFLSFLFETEFILQTPLLNKSETFNMKLLGYLTLGFRISTFLFSLGSLIFMFLYKFMLSFRISDVTAGRFTSNHLLAFTYLFTYLRVRDMKNETEGCQPQAQSSNVSNNLSFSYLFERHKENKRKEKGTERVHIYLFTHEMLKIASSIPGQNHEWKLNLRQISISCPINKH